jgi:Uma2 family endonuclease
MTLQERLPPGKYRLRVDDYVRLAEAGAFGDQRTELIEGDVIVMAPEFRPHAYVRDGVAYALHAALAAIGSDLHASSGSVLVTNDTMPQPDIVLTREPLGEGAIPLGSVALLVEVSATTLSNDMGLKRQIYARNGVAEYWVIDVGGRFIHQFWSPEQGTYTQTRKAMLGETLEAVTIAGLSIATPTL